MITKDEQNTVEKAIEQAESKTDAELVVVLAQTSDNYLYIPTLVAAIVALASPTILMFVPMWLDAIDTLLLQWAVFIGLTGVLRIPGILYALIPPAVKQYRAGNLARRQFLEQNLHHTHDDSGVLIFISAAEHYVEIIADRGIAQHVPNDVWQTDVDQLTAAIRAGKAAEGICQCIESCGEKLALHVPATSQKNELPNHLVLL